MAQSVYLKATSCSCSTVISQLFLFTLAITALAMSIISLLAWFHVNVGFLSFLVIPDGIGMIIFIFASSMGFYMLQGALLCIACKEKKSTTSSKSGDEAFFRSPISFSTVDDHSNNAGKSARSRLPHINLPPSSTKTFYSENLWNFTEKSAIRFGFKYYLDDENIIQEKKDELAKTFMYSTCNALKDLFQLELFTPYYIIHDYKIFIEGTHDEIIQHLEEFKINLELHPEMASNLEELLCEGVKDQSIGLVYFLLQIGCNVNAERKPPKWMNGTLLCLAAQNKDIKMVKLLLEKGADPNLVVNDNIALMYGVDTLEILKLLFCHGANLDFKPADKLNSPLNLCLLGCTIDSARFLLSKGADIAEISEKLHYWASRHNIQRIRFLIDLGLSVNILDVNNKTPLMHAAAHASDDKGLRFLLERGADVHLTDLKGNTALHYVKNYKNAYYLIKAGSSLTVTNNEGQTPEECLGESAFNLQSLIDYPLHAAFEFYDEEAIQSLIKQGFSLDQEDNKHLKPIDHCQNEETKLELIKMAKKTRKEQLRPLHNAVKNRDVAKVGEVLQALDPKIDINQRNKKGKTPLMLGVNFPEIVALLLERGSDVSITDLEGNSALHHAVLLNNAESCNLLIKEGAKTTLKNHKGETPMRLSRGNTQLEACFK